MAAWVQMILIQSIKANLNLPGPYSGHVHLAKGRADPCSKEKAEEQIFILLTILQQTHRIIAFAIFNQFWLTFGKVFYSCVKRNSYRGNMKPSKQA